jgi:hypothetical protein
MSRNRAHGRLRLGPAVGKHEVTDASHFSRDFRRRVASRRFYLDCVGDGVAMVYDEDQGGGVHGLAKKARLASARVKKYIIG